MADPVTLPVDFVNNNKVLFGYRDRVKHLRYKNGRFYVDDSTGDVLASFWLDRKTIKLLQEALKKTKFETE